MYAPSTVAMTAYNLIALAKQPLHVEALEQKAREIQLPGLPRIEFGMGIGGLISRGRVKVLDGEMIDLVDSKYRLVKSRDRSDAYEVDEDGLPIGGWNGWLLQCCNGPLVPLEEVL